jgi:DNA polymerase III subunit delta'
MVIDQTMSDFDQLIHQSSVQLELKHIIQTKKIPNALLFYGNEHTKRKEAAFLFAMGINCLNENRPCHTCKSCKKILANSHPDMILVDLLDNKQLISIAQIRELGHQISNRSNEAKYRMVLILNADLMNHQAQNALLKMLEEPPLNTFFILIAKKISLFLQTITSRCRKLRFHPLADKTIQDKLEKEFNIDCDTAKIMTATAGSDYGKAKTYLNLGDDDSIDWIKRRQWLLNSLIKIIQNHKGNNQLLSLMLSQKISQDPDVLGDTIPIIKSFFRDLLIYQHDPKKIVNLDFFDTFKDIGQKIKPKQFSRWLEDLHETEKRIRSNSSLRLSLDRFFLKLIITDQTEGY